MIDYKIRNINEDSFTLDFSSYVLGVDIGGTNTNIGIAGIKDEKPNLMFSLDFKSKELNSIIPAINITLDYVTQNYNFNIKSACVGVAGIVSGRDDIINLTNVHWNLSKNQLKNETPLENIVIINDFQVLGYGLNLLDFNNENDLIEIKRLKQKDNIFSNKAILGAGTGLGKTILVYDKNNCLYIPQPSEGGHSDFPVQNKFELELTEYIKDKLKISQPITYEELLSGRGIENIYTFLRGKKQFESTNFNEEIEKSKDKVQLISKYRNIDPACKESFILFTKYYARCAKNFVLDTMAIGGIYIAGGIASKNLEIFKSKEFIKEFENAYRRDNLLNKVPIYIIVNYDVSLLGACLAALHYFS